METEELGEAAGRLRDWFDNIDTKTSVLIAILTVVLGFTASEIKDTGVILRRSGLTAINMGFLVVWVLYLSCLFRSLYHAVHALSPELEERLSRTTDMVNVTDFPSIARLSHEEYLKEVYNTDDEQLKHELIWLCYQYARGVDHKFKHFIKAMRDFRFVIAAQAIIYFWITIVLPSGV